MEKLETELEYIFRHMIEYKGEEVCVDIHVSKNSDTKAVRVYTPVPDDHGAAYTARFYKKEEVVTMLEAKRKARELVTQATTDIDTFLSEKEGLEDFFDSLDKSVSSLEQKFEALERRYGEELEEI